MKRMTGVCVPMVTPMDDQGNLDLESTVTLTNHLIERGVSALYPCGTTGEVKNLTPEERKAFAECVVKTADGRVPVFVQVGGETTEVTADLARHAYECGADGLGMLTPTYYPLTDEELLDYYITCTHVVPEDFPIYLYGIPFLAVNRLSPALVARIAETCPNVKGIKYSVGDVLTLMSFAEIRNHTFDVLVAPVQMLLPALAAGMCGTVSGMCNVIPEDLNKMFALYAEGKIDECRELQVRVKKIANMFAAKEAAKCKAMLKRAGVLQSDTMRLPQKALSDAERTELFAFMDKEYPSYSFEGGKR